MAKETSYQYFVRRFYAEKQRNYPIDSQKFENICKKKWSKMTKQQKQQYKPPGGVKKRKWRPGTVALREIRSLKKKLTF